MTCVQEGLCAIIGTIRRGFDDLYEAKQTLVYGNTEDDGNYADEVQSRRSFYFGPSSGQGISGKGLHRRGSIPKTSYGSRRASSNSLMSMGRGNDRKDRGGAGGLSGSHSGGYQALRGPLKTPATPPSGGIGELFLPSYSFLFLLISSSSSSSMSSNGIVCALSGRSISSSFLSLLAPQRRQSDACEEMNSSMSNLEPVLLKISEASQRVMKNQKESAGEYMAVHR